MNSAPLDPESITAGFFGPGNGFRLDGPERNELQRWLDDLRHPARPAFLPRRLSDRRVRWYALARDQRQARDLREQLSAFLGPSYSDFDGRPIAIDSRDPVESVLAGRFAAVFALNVVNIDDAAMAEEQIKRLRTLLRRRPPRPEGSIPSRARWIREFDLALRAVDWPATERLLAECRSRGQFSLYELGGFKIRVLAERGEWQTVLDLPELADVLSHPRPAAVSEAVQTAIYHVYLVDLLDAERTEDAVALFRERLAHVFPALFRVRTATPESPAGRAATIAAAAFAARQPAIAKARTPEDLARQAFESNDYDAAYRLLVQCEPTSSVLAMLLLCADERIDSPSIAQAVLTMFEQAPEAVREATLARKVHRRIWSDLRDHLAPTPEPEPRPDSQSATQVPVDWIDWLDRLQRHGPWPKAAEAARTGVREWSTDSIRDDPAAQERFASQLGTRFEPQAAAILRNCLPQLLEAFLRGGGADNRLKIVYRKLLELLVFDSDAGIASNAAVAELAAAYLECGVNAGEHRDLVELLALVSERFQSPAQFDRAVQLLDLLAMHGVHLQTDVGPILQPIATSLRLAAGRVTDVQWATFERACADFGQLELFRSTRPAPVAIQEEDEDSRFRRELDGKTVALLTMTAQIAATFLRVVEYRFPKTRFKILNEGDESKLLRDVARSADLFIVNTYDVPHAASGPIKKYRTENTLYPAGKTGLQQAEALFRWLRTGATSPLNA